MIINKSTPLILHIDINSCFAHIEQQANPLIRNRPVVVAAYNYENGCVLAASKEAKKLGIKTGVRVREAKMLCPNLIFLPPDPEKYRAVHKKFIQILMRYTPEIEPKSIDEAVLNFKPVIKKPHDLPDIGQRIKDTIRHEIGECITTNVGIGPNRFLAKTAAGLHKPDGLDVIDHTNLIPTLQKLQLTDLCGIATQNEKRLNKYGIFTVMDFFNAPLQKLTKQVFQSIAGYHWYLRLHGWETDDYQTQRKSIGHSYVLQVKTADPQEILKLFTKLCVKTGKRLRKNSLQAQGIYVSIRFTDGSSYNISHKLPHPICTTGDIFKWTRTLLQPALEEYRTGAAIAMGVFHLSPQQIEQLQLFKNSDRELTQAIDDINNKFGDFTIVPATMIGMDGLILDRIAFGKVKDINYD